MNIPYYGSIHYTLLYYSSIIRGVEIIMYIHSKAKQQTAASCHSFYIDLKYKEKDNEDTNISRPIQCIKQK